MSHGRQIPPRSRGRSTPAWPKRRDATRRYDPSLESSQTSGTSSSGVVGTLHLTPSDSNRRRGKRTMPRAKVLVVDASEPSRAALSKALTGAGYEVAVAASGSAAVSALEWERPDVVVSHAQVQDMDGYELFVQVRRDPTTMETPF